MARGNLLLHGKPQRAQFCDVRRARVQIRHNGGRHIPVDDCQPLIAGLYVAKRWRRSRTVTPVQFLEKRYSLTIRQALAWTGFPIRIIDDALKIFSTAIFLYVGMKLSIISLPMAIGMSGVIMILYAVLGGQLGVMVTDFLQFIIKMVIVLFIFVFTIVKIVVDGALAGPASCGLSESPVGNLS